MNLFSRSDIEEEYDGKWQFGCHAKAAPPNNFKLQFLTVAWLWASLQWGRRGERERARMNLDG